MSDEPDDAGHTAAAQLSHDLLQSIAIVRAAVDTFRLRGAEGDAEEALGVVEREVAIMASRCEEELRGERFTTPIDPAATATNVIDRVRPTYTGELVLDLDGLDGAATGLRGSPTEWERSLLNLVENGCRAAGPQGKVLVRCRSTDETLTISVADSGPGFGRSVAGRSSLGMVAVMRLVEHHGGHLELRRSDLGGALLIIVVPLAD